MNKVEAQTRILRYLATIKHQVELLGRHGQNISIYTETAVSDAMTAVTGDVWRNLNGKANNFPGIDLISPDGTYAVQATAHVTKKKFDATTEAIAKELKLATNRLAAVKKVEVVGLTCVRNAKVTAWSEVSGPSQSLKIRGTSLEKRIQVENQSEAVLDQLDRAFHGLATTISPFHLRPDREELRSAIFPFMDRKAIRDHRFAGEDWRAMQEAMLSIRRLLTQGVNDVGVPTTRPYATFRPDAAMMLKQIYDETSQISNLLQDELRSQGSLRPSDLTLIEGHRLRIQELLDGLAADAGLAAPTWRAGT